MSGDRGVFGMTCHFAKCVAPSQSSRVFGPVENLWILTTNYIYSVDILKTAHRHAARTPHTRCFRLTGQCIASLPCATSGRATIGSMKNRVTPVSRQRAYQQRMRRAGKCRLCGVKRSTASRSLCGKHLMSARLAARRAARCRAWRPGRPGRPPNGGLGA